VIDRLRATSITRFKPSPVEIVFLRDSGVTWTTGVELVTTQWQPRIPEREPWSESVRTDFQQYKRDGDAARSLFNYLDIADILRLAIKAGTIQIDDDVIKAMKTTRDEAAHALENIVADYHAIRKLADVKRESLRILGGA
jgi:hypothetical protein